MGGEGRGLGPHLGSTFGCGWWQWRFGGEWAESKLFSCEFMVVQSPGREPWYILGLSGPDPVVMFCCEQAAPEVPFTSVSPPRHPQGPGPACYEQEGQAASLPSRPSSLLYLETQWSCAKNSSGDIAAWMVLWICESGLLSFIIGNGWVSRK